MEANAKPPKARLIVLSGPAGAGKTTVAEMLCKETGIARSVSATTRQPRPGEVDGRDYHFITEAEFERRVARGEFLEHATVHGHRYGTPRAPIEEALRRGESRLLVIDVQGAMQVKAAFPDALLIFLDAPDEALEERMAARGTETETERRTRRRKAQLERNYKEHYDFYVVNDNLQDTVARIRHFITDRTKPGERRQSLNG